MKFLVRQYYSSNRDKYSVNFTRPKKKFCLTLHYNGSNSFWYVSGVEIYKFKVTDLEMKPYPLCLGITFQKLLQLII